MSISKLEQTGSKLMHDMLGFDIESGGILGLILGSQGCLSGETTLRINRGNKRHSTREYTIREIYNKFNGVNSHEDEIVKTKVQWDKTIPTITFSVDEENIIRRNKIKNVYYSGKKKTYVVTTEKGKAIRATLDHRFLTSEGTYKQLKNISVGDLIVCRNKPIYKEKHKKVIKPRHQISGIIFHPYAYKNFVNGKNYKMLPKGRLIFEAHLNDLAYHDYIKILKTNPAMASKLNYVLPKFAIHHKDGNQLNDTIENLQVIKKIDHDMMHGHETYKKMHYANCELEKITAINYYGIEETYDIEMEEPYHNFVANYFVTHNSSKTSALLNMATYVIKQYPNQKVFFSNGYRTPIQSYKIKNVNKVHIMVKQDSGVYFQDRNNNLEEVSLNATTFTTFQDCLDKAKPGYLNTPFFGDRMLWMNFLNFLMGTGKDWIHVYIDELAEIANQSYMKGSTYNRINDFAGHLKDTRKTKLLIFSNTQQANSLAWPIMPTIMYYFFLPGARATRYTRVTQKAIDRLVKDKEKGNPCYIAAANEFGLIRFTEFFTPNPKHQYQAMIRKTQEANAKK